MKDQEIKELVKAKSKEVSVVCNVKRVNRTFGPPSLVFYAGEIIVCVCNWSGSTSKSDPKKYLVHIKHNVQSYRFVTEEEAIRFCADQLTEFINNLTKI